MSPRSADRARLEREVSAARQRALVLVPFSPSWDAAMSLVEELERALWRHDRIGEADDRVAGLDRACDAVLA